MDTAAGALSKAAKKNQKKRAAKKKATTKTEGTKPSGGLEPADLLPILKQELEIAKASKDHTRAGKLRDQLWVLNDLVAGVRTDIPESEYLEIINSLPIAKSTSPVPTEVTPSDNSGLTSTEKKIRSLKKKLDQIHNLKEKQKNAEKLEDSQMKKIENEQQIHDEITELEELMKSIL